MIFMRFDSFNEFNKTKETVKDISYDEDNNEYMSESELEAYNFDKVKKILVKNMILNRQNQLMD